MKKIWKYLFGAFGIAWVLQIVAGLLFRQGNNLAYSLVLAVSMFAPLVAAWIAKAGVKEIGWRVHIKKNWRWILCAWFLPAVLGSVGAVLYFALVPKAFDSSYQYILALLGTEGLQQLEASGLSVELYTVISVFSSITYAPFFNMLFAVGEEAGWRGVMYPELKKHYGKTYGRIIGGIIWGIWHWPIMLLAGYEYGTSYPGAPITGPLLFCVITTAMGIVFDFFYEKTGSIWVPALCHGAINAFAGVPTLFLNPDYADQLLVGPLMVGIVGGLPLILCAVGMSMCRNRAEEGNEA